MIAAERLTPLALFQGVDGRVVSSLAAIAVEVHFATDEVVFLTGSEPRGWFVVVEGRVRVVRGSGSRQHVVHTEGPGGTLGEVPLFARGTHPATAIAAEPTTCALFSRRSLEAAVSANADVAFLLLERLALRVRGLVERLDDRSAHSVQARLAAFLLQRVAPGGTSVAMGMTQQALAEELGTVREVVSRELRGLSAAGVIVARGGGRYTVLDPVRLRAAAE